VCSRYLALGYWRQPELTEARFGAGPAGSGERAYRTGDLGRYTPDGQLELLGRSDRAHKLHGRWVDLQSIEAALMRAPGVRDAVALVRESRTGGSELVAYLVAQEGGSRPGPAVLREALAAAPEGPAAPTRFVWLDALPMDANGKVARQALPEPPRERPPVTSAWAAPAGATEEALARLWAEVLGLDAVGVHDDFAELGGGSLQAIDLATRAEALFGLRHSAPRLIEASTVAGMARRIDELRAATPAAPAARA
jgi:nonribosomal peptide synthetase DhbF